MVCEHVCMNISPPNYRACYGPVDNCIAILSPLFVGLTTPFLIQMEVWLTNTWPKIPQTCCNKLVNFIKSFKIRLVATCHFQTCYNLLKQLAANLWITSFDNQLAISLLKTCNRLVVNKLSQLIFWKQAVLSYANAAWYWLVNQFVARCQHTCCNLHIFGCVVNVTSTLASKIFN